MSAEVRELLAIAASTGVGGVNTQPYFVQTTAAGLAFVRLDRIEYQRGYATGFWSIVVQLPTDRAAAEKYLEQWVPEMVESLSAEMHVLTVTPQDIDFGSGAIPCAVISGHREE